ncbi:hypothetical protein RND71_019509 [Anisodus tanguticus]|uniref:Uncharacterized protein n=1 Tax=Anisodus tanguticus TaxID=243964 RepID=A0AAE1S0M7_9SOLA|nr:hypothetical protein RND71_019509 [Anisodus tanguticus]
MRVIVSDLINLNEIEDEFTKKLGFRKVKQLLVKGPSGRVYLVEGWRVPFFFQRRMLVSMNLRS